ncbi:protein ZGRF1 isoform X4 [Parus major]|uniref:protein ZGRF1 isoform X4 n=1 Tax=Parus major TaxID=9157 RepID=UPI0007713E15|nr:protein ZGRF1 isoform X4 [Parus major]
MASQEFTVLYTHQKMKKSKTWQDGILRVRTERNQATLFDDKGQCLESIFIKSQVTPGDDLESERYLITVEAVKVSEQPSKDQPKKAETPAVDRNGVKPALLPPRHLPVGLKRKFTGFQGPRQVEKKIPVVEDEGKATVVPLSKECQGSFPSKFYISSPLFSMIGKKDAETNPSAGCQEEGCRDSNREQMSVSSLLSAPFSDSCEETEKQNSSRFVVRAESPLLTGHAGPGAVSHHIRSTAQIIALLKSKPAQGHREQTSGVTGCLSRFQAAENADLCDKKSPVLPAFLGDPTKGLVPDTQHLPFMQGTVNDKKLWNAQTLPNSAGQPCGEEVTGQRQDKKVMNLSQELQDHCNTDSYSLPESTVSRISDSQFVPSSGDISYSASPTTLENNPFGYREHSGTDSPRENFSVKVQSELHPRENSEGVSSDPELSGDVILAEAGIVKEEFSLQGPDCSPDGELMEVNFNLMETFDFNDIDHEDVCEREGKEFSEGDSSWSPGCLQGEDVAQDAALRPHLKPHSCCEVETHSKNEVKCSISDGEGGPPSQLCDNDARRTAADDAANQTRTKAELVADGCNIKEINESQSSFGATNKGEDLDGCAALTTDGTSWIKNQQSDLLPDDTKVNECHPKTRMSEAAGSLPGISPSRIISAMDKKTEEAVAHLGCMESPNVGSEHFWGTESDGIKPDSPLLALSQKSDPLGAGYSSPEGTTVGEIVLESAESITASPEACKGETIGVDSLKCTAVAENCSGLPDLVNDIALLRALAQHSTALESLQKLEENASVFCETDTSKETLEPLEKDEARKEFTEMPYSESLQASSCSYFDSPGLMPSCVDNLFQKTEAYTVPIAAAQRDPGTSDCQPKSPGASSLHKDDVDIIREGNFQVMPAVIEEPGINQSSLALDVYPEHVPPWTMPHSPSDPRQAQWAAWKPGKTSPLDPDSTISPPWENEDTVGDICEPLTHGILPSEAELPDFFFTQEKSSYPEECSLPGSQPLMKARIPFLALPATNKIPGVFHPTENKKLQQSLGSSGGNLSSEPVAFPRSTPGPEDRNYETSVFGEYTEDGQRASVPQVLPNVTAQHRQSKWLKYQSSAQWDLIPENSADREENDDICAQSILGMLPGDTGEDTAVNPSAPSSAPLLPARSSPGECSRAANTSHPDLVSEGKVLSLHLRQTPLAEATQKVLSHLSCHAATGEGQDITISELSFPAVDKVKHANLPKRKISIPAVFQSHTHYKQVFKAALTEQLNIMLFELAQRLHNALSKVDISFYTALKDGQSQSQGSCAPLCNHMHPAKLVMVKKEGQNKGRLFYACDAPKAEQCSFFKWIEDVNPTQTKSRPSAVLHDTRSIGTYLRSQKIAVYEECQLLESL